MKPRLPMTEYEDRVGTRIKLINYSHMAYLITDAAKHSPHSVEQMLTMWGEAIYTMGQGHEPAPHLIQPLTVVGS